MTCATVTPREAFMGIDWAVMCEGCGAGGPYGTYATRKQAERACSMLNARATYEGRGRAYSVARIDYGEAS